MVFVHGAFQGAFVWKSVMTTMKAIGWSCTAPTLKGLADRQSELTMEVDCKIILKKSVNILINCLLQSPSY
jgi:hypothetical protein